MKIIKTYETEEIPKPHFIHVRALHVSDQVQFEHLILLPGQEQKKHVAYTTVYLYVLDGEGVLEADEERIQLTTDMLVEMLPETRRRLIQRGEKPLLVLNVKTPPPTIATHIVT